jgi:predicted permease
MRTIRSRLRSLTQWRAVKRDIDDELSFHLERRTAENMASGMSTDEAARDARRRFGNVQSVREECREARGGNFGEAWLRDLKFGFRTLMKSPGFTIVAALMLAIGIGSVTTIFGGVRAFVTKPYSSPNGDRLVHLWSDELKPLSVPDYFEFRARSTSFAELGMYAPRDFNVGGDHPTGVNGADCTPGVLRAFGVAPALGRWLEDADENPGAPPAAVISYRVWHELFGADSTLIGRTIRLEDADVTVVGVMPANFEFSWLWMGNKTCEIWRAFRLRRDSNNDWNWCTIGCLKTGVTLSAADSEIKAIGAQLKAARGDAGEKYPFLATSLRYELARYEKSYAWMILTATLLVLAVACANVASMLLARGLRRRGEIGVRVALGASPGAILRLALSESLLLALAGTIGGVALAPVEMALLRSLDSSGSPRMAAMTMDGNAFVFAAGLCLLTGLLAGFPAALAALRISAGDLLRTDNRAAAGSATRHRLLRGLVVTQVAVAFILANVAVLLSASYAKMITANSKIAKDYVLSAELNLHSARYNTNDALARFCEQLSKRIVAVPGVFAAGVVTDLPLEWGPAGGVLANDEVYDPKAQGRAAVFSAITPEYFAAADIPILHGETLRRTDRGWGNIGVVVNRAFADKYWPGQNALGKIVRPNAPQPYFQARVVGVVENVRQWGPNSQPQPQLYWTMDHAWGKTIFLIVRSSQPGAALATALRRAVAELDPDLPLSRIRTFKDIVRDATFTGKIVTGMANGCMMAAIVLAAIGLYGTLSYHVQQRTREIGVRIALGANRGDLVRLVFRQGLAWVLPGIILGTIGALLSAKALRACVYDVNTISPVALTVSMSAVFFATALACLLPAHRASRVEPMEALRCE